MKPSLLLKAGPVVVWLAVGVLGQASTPDEWIEPAHWADVGTVGRWMDLDLRFNHGYVDHVSLTVAGDRQEAIYDRTLRYGATVPALEIDAFMTLSETERVNRADLARHELQLVVRLLNKLSGGDRNSWQADQTDVDLMGAMLERLNNATGVDPTNPYVWHLLGWFRAQIGDLAQATHCYEMTAKALTLVPAGRLTDMRRRLALDQAWLQRDQGRFKSARGSVEAAEEYGGPDFESRLILGLLAAAAGNQSEAERYAKLVQDVGNYGLEHGRQLRPGARRRLLRRGGRMAASWIDGLLWLRLGYVEWAADAFPNWGIGKEILPRPWFANLFWRDAGYIYYQTDRPELALAAWRLGTDFTPYRPFFVKRQFSAPPRGMAGLSEILPFSLNFGLFFGGGSRFGYALSLARNLGTIPDPTERGRELAKVETELFICLRAGEFTPQTFLTLEHLYRQAGQLPQAADCHEQAVAAFRELGFTVTSGPPGTMVVLSDRVAKSPTQTVVHDRQTGAKVVWEDPQPVQKVLDEIQDAYFASPTAENRRELARFLIRNLRLAEGRELLLHGRGNDPGAGDDLSVLADEDLVILLEAERGAGIDSTARALVDSLQAATAARPHSSEVWAMAGAILLETGDQAGGIVALQRASELDPENGGLRMQLRMLGH